MFRIVDTWGRLADIMCDSVGQAHKRRIALNHEHRTHARFWVRPA